MASRTAAPRKTIPPLVRDLTLTALDTLSAKVAAPAEGVGRTAIQTLADAWRALSAADREELLALTAAAGTRAVAAAKKQVRRKAKPKPVVVAPSASAEPETKKKDRKKKEKEKKKMKKKDKKKKKKDQKA
ncbi:MAG: hypothetical protein JWO56_2282 [Acidobacteria bacterium]|nr:hypothetical protein [Acidobacteriota bacterium]